MANLHDSKDLQHDDKELAVKKDTLYDCVSSSLRNTGVLDNLESQARKEVLGLFVGGGRLGKSQQERPAPESNFVINELIKEYLEWNGYSNASQVLCLESGHPKTKTPRPDLEASLNVECGQNSRKVPLLYTIVSRLKNNPS